MNQIDQKKQEIAQKRQMVRSNGWTILVREVSERQSALAKAALSAGVAGPDRDATVAAAKYAGITEVMKILNEWEEDASGKTDD